MLSNELFAIKILTPHRMHWNCSNFFLRWIVFRICMACYRRKWTVLPGNLILSKNNPKNGLSGVTRIALFSLWEELEAKLLRPGQLLGYAWNLWDITLQMGYVENFTCYLNPFTWIKTSNFLTYMSCLTEQKYMYFFVMIMFLIF